MNRGGGGGGGRGGEDGKLCRGVTLKYITPFFSTSLVISTNSCSRFDQRFHQIFGSSWASCQHDSKVPHLFWGVHSHAFHTWQQILKRSSRWILTNIWRKNVCYKSWEFITGENTDDLTHGFTNLQHKLKTSQTTAWCAEKQEQFLKLDCSRMAKREGYSRCFQQSYMYYLCKILNIYAYEVNLVYNVHCMFSKI